MVDRRDRISQHASIQRKKSRSSQAPVIVRLMQRHQVPRLMYLRLLLIPFPVAVEGPLLTYPCLHLPIDKSVHLFRHLRQQRYRVTQVPQTLEALEES